MHSGDVVTFDSILDLQICGEPVTLNKADAFFRFYPRFTVLAIVASTASIAFDSILDLHVPRVGEGESCKRYFQFYPRFTLLWRLENLLRYYLSILS